MLHFPGWMRKNFIPKNFNWRVSAETWDASCFKKGLLEKQQSIPNTCNISPLKKIFFSKLNRCIFQISLKYRHTLTHNITPTTTTTKIKISISDSPPPAKTFLKYLAPPPSWRGRGCMPLIGSTYWTQYFKVKVY